jgi:hypothetical protein
MAVRSSLILSTLAAGAIAAALSCGDPPPVGVDLSALPLAAAKSQAGGLVPCTPLPYDSVTQVIGPAGGMIAVGPHFLWIDSLALSTPVTITAVAPRERVRRVRLKPDGLVFQKTAFLVTSYESCNVKNISSPRIAQVSDQLEILTYLATASGTDTVVVGQYEGTWYVAGELHHFSNYAVAW